MAITVEGVRISTSIEALEPGEGFLVRVDANWNANRQDDELRRAVREAQTNRILGSRLNGHESTYQAAEASASLAVDAFETDIIAFISGWNTLSGSGA